MELVYVCGEKAIDGAVQGQPFPVADVSALLTDFLSQPGFKRFLTGFWIHGIQ